jgi:PAS domain-containing protein
LISGEIELVRGIQTNLNNGEFVLVLRTDGRIVAMSDEVEHHLGKTMRSLYTQCINIFECLDNVDGRKLRTILDSSNDLVNNEHRLVCTFRLPKGKRPSRTREDIKAISIAGHFYSCHDSCHERLFVARCEALVSRTTSGTSSSQTALLNNTMIKLTLNDDMTVSMVSSNIKDILGYSRNEIIGHWFGRFLATNDLEKFETIRKIYFENNQQTPINVCDILDIYTNNGESRLTFLCQIRPTRERRSKSVKYSIIAQLIDPSMRSEYVEYVHTKLEPNQVTIKVEQYHQRQVKIPSWPIVRHLPWVSSCSTMSTIMNLSINNNHRLSVDHSQMLLHHSYSMMNLPNYSTTNMINVQQTRIHNTGRQKHSMIHISNINLNKN